MILILNFRRSMRVKVITAGDFLCIRDINFGPYGLNVAKARFRFRNRVPTLLEEFLPNSPKLGLRGPSELFQSSPQHSFGAFPDLSERFSRSLKKMIRGSHPLRRLCQDVWADRLRVSKVKRWLGPNVNFGSKKMIRGSPPLKRLCQDVWADRLRVSKVKLPLRSFPRASSRFSTRSPRPPGESRTAPELFCL